MFNFFKRYQSLLRSNQISKIVFLVVVAAIILMILSVDPPDDEEDGSEANPYVPEVPFFTARPSAMPELSPEPSVGLIIESSMTLDRDYLFEDDKFEILVSIRKSNIVLNCNGHRINGNANYALEGHGIRDVTVKNCNFTGPFQGATFWEVERITISDTVFAPRMNGLHVIDAVGFRMNNTQWAPEEIPSHGFAVEIKSSVDVQIEKNTIKDFEQGFLLYDTSEFSVRENEISNITETGIGTFQIAAEKYSHHGLIEKNDIRECLMALEIHTGSHDIDIRNNVLEKNAMAVRMDDEHGTPRYGPVYNILFEGNQFLENKDKGEYILKNFSTITGI